ncbi:MAG TPA: alkaline phosphatase family protein [Gallionellaceae bacterium]|nr:alkaline phosphatase family protein [Gallionellaceae bacterium]
MAQFSVTGVYVTLRLLAILVGCFALQAIAQPLPRPDHIVIVIEENKAYGQIIGNGDTPYINALAKRGMLFTQSYGVTHPSQPNYLALFSGTTHGITGDECPLEFSGDNLASALIAKGLSFASYAESMPVAGAFGCVYGVYYRKHNPAADWKGLEAMILPFSAFPQDFEKLPTVALVVPNLRNDMHDGSIADGDAWLEKNIGSYAKWTLTHNSLLIVTWDEDNHTDNNRIATIFVGSMVKRGNSAQRINHYSILRTIEEMYGLTYLNESAQAKPIRDAWRASRRAGK